MCKYPLLKLFCFSLIPMSVSATQVVVQPSLDQLISRSDAVVIGRISEIVTPIDALPVATLEIEKTIDGLNGFFSLQVLMPNLWHGDAKSNEIDERAIWFLNTFAIDSLPDDTALYLTPNGPDFVFNDSLLSKTTLIPRELQDTADIHFIAWYALARIPIIEYDTMSAADLKGFAQLPDSLISDFRLSQSGRGHYSVLSQFLDYIKNLLIVEQ